MLVFKTVQVKRYIQCIILLIGLQLADMLLYSSTICVSCFTCLIGIGPADGYSSCG